jgi:hypothetical protein
MASGNRYVTRTKPSGLLATSTTSDSAKSVTKSYYEAIVVDVIVDHFHPQYSADGYNVGMIKVRIFSVHDGRDDELLDWAEPMDTTIQELPLLGEFVVLHKFLGNFFYMRKVNIAHRLQENSMLKLNDALNNRSKKLSSPTTSGNGEIESEPHQFGEYYKPDSRVRPLKHFEGDVLFQGRMGHSIRFGSSQIDPSSKGMAPNLILRTGQAKDVETDACTSDKIFGLILEDVNKDASSIWMTSDQVIPYEPTTINVGSFYRSIKNPPQQYDGASIILNSDRIVLGAKKTHIMMFAQEEIYLNSFKNTAVDTDSSIILTANIDIRNLASRNIDNIADNDYTISVGNNVSIIAENAISFVADKLYFGSVTGDAEPMVGGTSLSKWLARLIVTLMGTPSAVLPWVDATTTIVPLPVPGPATAAHVITPVGPGLLNPDIMAGLIRLYGELVLPNPGQSIPTAFSGAPFNSGDGFVKLGNEVPEIVENNFKTGKPTVIENNTWTLTDNYYRTV